MVADLAPPAGWVEAFFRDYVSGTRELDYDAYLGYAGLKLATETEKRAALGFLAARSDNGPITVASVEAASSAERAGLRRGDILLKINGQNLTALPQDVVGLKPGHLIQLEVRRRSRAHPKSGERTVKLKFELGTETTTRYAIHEVANPNDAQYRVRQGWLNGTTN